MNTSTPGPLLNYTRRKEPTLEGAAKPSALLLLQRTYHGAVITSVVYGIGAIGMASQLIQQVITTFDGLRSQAGGGWLDFFADERFRRLAVDAVVSTGPVALPLFASLWFALALISWTVALFRLRKDSVSSAVILALRRQKTVWIALVVAATCVITATVFALPLHLEAERKAAEAHAQKDLK